jgi:hypothetical protein
MSNTSGASQDILARRLLAAFEKPIKNAQTHANHDEIFKHLKELCPDPSEPLTKKNDQDNFTKVPILKAWEKDDPKTFNNAIDTLLKTYPLPNAANNDNLDDLARKLQAFQDGIEPFDDADCPNTIATAIEDIAAKYTDPLAYPPEWVDNGYAGAIAALARFTTEYKGKGTAPPGNDPGDDAPEKLWPKFTALVTNETIKKESPRWERTRTTCGFFGCDWADVKFMLEFDLRQGKPGTDAALHTAASDFLRTCPEVLELMEKDFWGDKDMHTIYQAYRDRHPRTAKSRDSRSLGTRQSRTPGRDRDNIPSRPKKVKVVNDFDKIYVNDPDQGGKRVQGTIVYAWPGWLDVKMPKIIDENSGEKFSAERYNAFPQSAHPNETKIFKDGAPQKWLNKADKDDLKGLGLKDVTINHFTYAKAPRQDPSKRKLTWPRVYVVGYVNNKPKDERFMTVWVRTTFSNNFPTEGIDAIMLEQRKQDGLPHPGESRIAEIVSDPGSDSDSDDSLPF